MIIDDDYISALAMLNTIKLFSYDSDVMSLAEEAFEKIKETRETNARAQRAKAAREKSIKV